MWRDYIRNNTKVFIGGAIAWAVVLGLLAYTVITFRAIDGGFKKIANVEACTAAKGVRVPAVLPNQTVRIEETGNLLGAASDCWVRIGGGGVQYVAIINLRKEYERGKSRNSRPSDFRGHPTYVYSFSENFYRGDVTVYRKVPKKSTPVGFGLNEKLLSDSIGRHVVSKLPANTDVPVVSKGFVWGVIVPLLFEDSVQGSLPKAP